MPFFDNIYRVRNGKFLGVCGGLARHFDINPDTFRLFALGGIIITGIVPGFIFYFILALLLPLES